MSTIDVIFNQMVEDFKTNHNKQNLIRIMTEYCSRNNTEPQDIYNLKKLLETEFSKKVDCTYCYKTQRTPIDYGCDLREIFYNRNNELIEGGQALLNIFKDKKLPDIWHIMTDIDDTLYPNIEHSTYIAGSDISWAQKTPYPGIITFYELFYKKLPINSKYTTILSATPGCLKNSKLNDSILREVLQNYGFIQGVEGKFEIASYTGRIITNMGSNLAGRALDKIDSFLPVNKYITRASSASTDNISNLFKLFGNTKFERFKQYLNIFPEYKIIFIGDNGQGDVLAGMQMLNYMKKLELDDRCHVFIHKVSENGRTFKVVPEETNNESERLNFFTNYYELSLKFKDLEIFQNDDVEQIRQSIVTKLKTSPYRQFIELYTNIPGVTSGGKFTRKNNRKARKYALTRKIRKYKSTKKLKKQNYKTTKKLK